MSVLSIRAHKRFGVCRKVKVINAAEEGLSGLLIELSLEGCRISDIDTTKVSMYESMTVVVDDLVRFQGTIRWCDGRVIGLRLQKPFHISDLERLILSCRSDLHALISVRA